MNQMMKNSMKEFEMDYWSAGVIRGKDANEARALIFAFCRILPRIFLGGQNFEKRTPNGKTSAEIG
jgi:hypothetical protein